MLIPRITSKTLGMLKRLNQEFHPCIVPFVLNGRSREAKGRTGSLTEKREALNKNLKLKRSTTPE